MKNSQVHASFKNARISPKKVSIVMDLVRGKSLDEAKLILKFDKSKASDMILKTLKSAEANAKHNLNLGTNNLYVSELYVCGGPVIKRMRIGAKSRGKPILKRNSHINVGLSERSKGENK